MPEKAKLLRTNTLDWLIIDSVAKKKKVYKNTTLKPQPQVVNRLEQIVRTAATGPGQAWTGIL